RTSARHAVSASLRSGSRSSGIGIRRLSIRRRRGLQALIGPLELALRERGQLQMLLPAHQLPGLRLNVEGNTNILFHRAFPVFIWNDSVMIGIIGKKSTIFNVHVLSFLGRSSSDGTRIARPPPPPAPGSPPRSPPPARGALVR